MAFIDGYATQNAANAIGLQIDYNKLFDYLEGDDLLIRANYYACVPDGDQHNPVQKVLDWLSYNGFNVIRKKMRSYDNGNEIKVKNSVTVEIATDILEAARHVDCIVLFSGDGDYRYLIDRVQRTSGAYVVVFADKDTASDELRRQADKFVDLKTIAAHIAKDPKPEENAEAA